MPLLSGSSKATIGKNIATERASGKKLAQAVAIAMSKAGKSREKGEHGEKGEVGERGEKEIFKSKKKGA